MDERTGGEMTTEEQQLLNRWIKIRKELILLVDNILWDRHYENLIQYMLWDLEQITLRLHSGIDEPSTSTWHGNKQRNKVEEK